MNNRQLTDEELCAFADERLDEADAGRIRALLDSEPGLEARMADWQAQGRALHERFDPVLDEAIPERLLAAAEGERASARPRRGWPVLRHAAAVGWLAIGLVAGYAIRSADSPPPITVASQPSLPKQAAIAHAVYVPEVRHPVEVGAEQQAHLVGWLSKRLGTNVRAPELAADGFALMGGRLLPGDAGPVAQFMYQDGSGRRLTLYLTHDKSDRTDTAFRFAEENGLGVFYWVDGGTGYALSADMPRDDLLHIATLVYRELNP
ncbi:MAG: anti-sigma factor [Rhodocyclaceae bacterium]|nr:anti-sigma factor [Rhodocyclaceae bacterium]